MSVAPETATAAVPLAPCLAMNRASRCAGAMADSTSSTDSTPAGLDAVAVADSSFSPHMASSAMISEALPRITVGG